MSQNGLRPFLINRTFKAGKVFNAVVGRMDELAELEATEVKRYKADKVSAFLSVAAALTEQQCRQIYATLSMSPILYNQLQKRCERFISDSDAVIASIVIIMPKKINHCLPVMVMGQAKLARILYPIFLNDFLQDSDILRRYVVLPINEEGAA